MDSKKFLAGILSFVSLASVLTPFVSAAAASYYAKVSVYYNIPTDTSFNIAFPSTYTSGFNETAANTTTTNWISFNFTTTSDTFIQPRTTGDAGKAQSGSLVPIFLIYNTGNTAETMALNATVPTGYVMCANASCTGGDCTSPVATCTALGAAGYTTMFTGLGVGKKGNITLFANSSSSSTAGQSAGNVFIQSSAG